MTYTERINFQEKTAEQTPSYEPTTFQKLKTLKKEGAERSQRVADILRSAFSETAAEFKAGRTVISPLAKEVTAETVSVVKENGRKVSDTVNQAWQDADDDDINERMIRFIRTLAATTKSRLFPQLERQLINLDDVLSERYGDRYAQIKAKLSVARASYPSAQNDSTAPHQNDAVDVPAIEVDSEVVR